MALKGKRQLNARMRAISQSFKPMGRKWAAETVELSRPQIKVVTGKTRASLRVRNATQKRATVYGSFVAKILDAGAKAHEIVAKKSPLLIFEAGGRTIFTRKVNHRGVRASGYAGRAAREALRRNPMAETLIDEWNKAA